MISIVEVSDDLKPSLDRLLLGSHKSRLDVERLIKDSKSNGYDKSESRPKSIPKLESIGSPVIPSEECPEVDIGGPVNQPTLFGSSIKAQN